MRIQIKLTTKNDVSTPSASSSSSIPLPWLSFATLTPPKRQTNKLEIFSHSENSKIHAKPINVNSKHFSSQHLRNKPRLQPQPSSASQRIACIPATLNLKSIRNRQIHPHNQTPNPKRSTRTPKTRSHERPLTFNSVLRVFSSGLGYEATVAKKSTETLPTPTLKQPIIR